MSIKLVSLVTGAIAIAGVGCLIIKSRFRPQILPSKDCEYPTIECRTIPLNFARPLISHPIPPTDIETDSNRIILQSVPTMIPTGKETRTNELEVKDGWYNPPQIIVNGCEINNLMELSVMSKVTHKELRSDEQPDGTVITREYYITNPVRYNYLTVQGLFDGTRFINPKNTLARLHNNPEPNIEIDNLLITWGIVSLYSLSFVYFLFAWI